VAVGVAEEGSDLPATIDWLRQELGAPSPKGLIRSTTVGYSHGKLVTHAIPVGRWFEGDRGLARSRAAAGDEKEPGALELEDSRRSSILAVQLGAEHFRIETPSSLNVLYDQENCELNAFDGKLR
jgi:hypothetical protein